VQPPAEVFARRLLAARGRVATTTRPAVTPRLVSLASVRGPSADGGPGVLGGALVLLLAAAFMVRSPSLPLRRRHGGG
jgi:hypothetical protein